MLEGRGGAGVGSIKGEGKEGAGRHKRKQNQRCRVQTNNATREKASPPISNSNWNPQGTVCYKSQLKGGRKKNRKKEGQSKTYRVAAANDKKREDKLTVIQIPLSRAENHPMVHSPRKDEEGRGRGDGGESMSASLGTEQRCQGGGAGKNI